MTIFNVFSLLGGLALFLFGMDIMGKALEKAGRRPAAEDPEQADRQPPQRVFSLACASPL